MKPPPSGPGRPLLLVSADDRTGVLESGGSCAELGFEVVFNASPNAGECVLVDLASRHLAPAAAKRRMWAVAKRPAAFRCHKMDSGLRGNWAHETAALVAAGHRIGLLASFPSAGRRCVDGVVFIHGVPVAQSAFGRDPRSRLTSSRPADYLEAAGCGPALRRGEVVVLDAADNDQLAAAANRCRQEDRVVVGTTGGIGAFAATLRTGAGARSPTRLPRPALIVCGSLHPLSREQLDRLDCPRFLPDEHEAALAALAEGRDAALITPAAATVTDAQAEAMAARLAAAAWQWLRASGAPTVVIVGGDTAAAVLGERPLRVHGNADVGVPVATLRDHPLTVVTKGGGIGAPTTLRTLLA